MNRQGTPIHPLIRYCDRVFGVDTVAAHAEVIAQLGYVWLGKQGKPLGRAMVARLSEQLSSKTPTFLYLVGPRDQKHRVLRCTLGGISNADPPAAETDCIPAYYGRPLSRFSTWFRLASIAEVPSDEFDGLCVVGSGRPVWESLAGSMSGHFYVGRR